MGTIFCQNFLSIKLFLNKVKNKFHILSPRGRDFHFMFVKTKTILIIPANNLGIAENFTSEIILCNPSERPNWSQSIFSMSLGHYLTFYSCIYFFNQANHRCHKNLIFKKYINSKIQSPHFKRNLFWFGTFKIYKVVVP